MTALRTVGHGTLPADDFVSLLRSAGVESIVDIRSFPGSRRNPQYGREEMERWLPQAGIGYRWMRSLGGRRRPAGSSRHEALRHPAFRAYADHMDTEELRSGVDDLLVLAADTPLAVMCSESVWWRCHRRLLSDRLVLVDGADVRHLMHDGRQSPHALTEGVRAEGDGVVYDVGTTPSLIADEEATER